MYRYDTVITPISLVTTSTVPHNYNVCVCWELLRSTLLATSKSSKQHVSLESWCRTWHPRTSSYNWKHVPFDRFRLTPMTMTGVPKIRAKKGWQGCGDKGTLVCSLLECKLVQRLWKTMWSFLKKLKIELLYDPEILDTMYGNTRYVSKEKSVTSKR